MDDRIVSVEREGVVAVVRFDRGESLNAFNQKLIRELTAVARAFHDDLDTRAVVLTGSARAFSAGIDLRDPETWTRPESDVAAREQFYRGVRLCRAWEDMPQITVAAIEGLAVGAGVALAIACDWRVIARDAYLYVPEVRIGLNLQWGALPRLVALVGPARAKRITILCERMAAEEAVRWGLAEEIAEAGRAVEVARDLARRAAEMPAAAVRIVKEAVNATAGALHRATSFADADQSALTAAHRDARAAREAFDSARRLHPPKP
jgi:enoyl-CoA hydratase/carnithine racemase